MANLNLLWSKPADSVYIYTLAIYAMVSASQGMLQIHQTKENVYIVQTIVNLGNFIYKQLVTEYSIGN